MDIQEYVTRDGRSPFATWLRGLRDVQARARIRVRLDRVRLGNLGDYRSVGDGVYELRLTYGPGYRLYFTRRRRTEIVMLVGGDKSTRTRDIERAQRVARELGSEP